MSNMVFVAFHQTSLAVRRDQFKVKLMLPLLKSLTEL